MPTLVATPGVVARARVPDATGGAVQDLRTGRADTLGACRLDERLEEAGLDRRVVVQQEDGIRPVAERGVGARVDPTGEAAVLAEREQADSGELRRHGLRPAVGRAVVDDDDRQLGIRGALQRPKAGERVLAPVPAEDDGSDPRGHASSRR